MREMRAAMSPEQRELQRAKNRELKKIARRNATPEQRAKERERKKTARLNATPEQRALQRAEDRKRKRARLRPFWGVDGEGAGTDDKGRQNYVLMAASGNLSGSGIENSHTVHRDGAALSVRDCLEFILSLPRDPILVGFAFGYDANQILRGIRNPKAGGRDPFATLRRILDLPSGPYGPRSTFWSDYAITWQPGQYLRVSRLDRSTGKASSVEGSARTVYDVFGFFQCSFVKALENWNIGTPEERAFIADNKARRDEFAVLDDDMVRYCAMECRLLASLMNEFRDVCIKVDVVPEQWSGPGWIAAALFEKCGIPKRPLTEGEAKNRAPSNELRRPKRDDEFERAAHQAFYGGRFENSRIGHVPGPVYEYDLNSAYPAAMPRLPCSMHTRWVHRPDARRLPKNGLYLAKVAFEHLPGHPWCGLPFRRKQRLYWPYQGTGWYWSPEIEAAKRCLGAHVRVLDLWVAEQTCDCRQYDWVSELYAERKRLGKATRGYPLKLGLNSLYGKMAQQSGRAPYHDAVAAGLVTAMTRTRLIEAIGHAPHAVVMIATDAIYSTERLPLDNGDGLGQWEEKEWPDLFIVKGGIYFSPSEFIAAYRTACAAALEEGAHLALCPAHTAPLLDLARFELPAPRPSKEVYLQALADGFNLVEGVREIDTALIDQTKRALDLTQGGKVTIKSRGVARSVVGDAAPQFMRAWGDWVKELRERGVAAMLEDRKSIPKVPLKVRAFHGCALALARRKPSLAGTWKYVSREEGFDWATKRDATWAVELDGDSIATMPIRQSKDEISEGYEPVDFDSPEENVHENFFEACDQPDHVAWFPHEE